MLVSKISTFKMISIQSEYSYRVSDQINWAMHQHYLRSLHIGLYPNIYKEISILIIYDYVRLARLTASSM